MERVIVTASAGSFPGLSDALRVLNVSVEERPLIEFREPSSWGALDFALDRLDSYGTIALTSPRAAAALRERLVARRGGVPKSPATPPGVWAAGDATAAALAGVLGPVRVPDHREPTTGAAETLARAIIAARAPGPVLFPCGNTRRDELPELLRGAGIVVEEIVCYESFLASDSAAQMVMALATVVVAASPSVVRLLVRACSGGTRPELIAVGPTTAATARSSGWIPAAVSAQPSTDGIRDAVHQVFASRSAHE
jgi:uroporphyrinogen-III synthase